MKKSTAFFTVLFLVLGTTLPAQSVEEILKEHFSAIGQDNMLKLNTQRLSGKMVQSGLEIPFIQMGKRPAKVRVEGTFQDLTFIQTFNGKEGWSINPFAGVTDPQQMTEDDLKGISEPMLFGIFGRFKALEPLVGKGISDENIKLMINFLTADCSCLIKDNLPGTDILFTNNWENPATALVNKILDENPHLLHH